MKFNGVRILGKPGPAVPPRPRRTMLPENYIHPRKLSAALLTHARNLAGMIHGLLPNGPELWSKLHRRAIAHEGVDDSAWLSDFAEQIIGRCPCRKQWEQDILATPPDFTNYFAWTVAMHNRVNARLGKPILTVEEARARWTQDIPAVPAKVGS